MFSIVLYCLAYKEREQIKIQGGPKAEIEQNTLKYDIQCSKI